MLTTTSCKLRRSNWQPVKDQPGLVPDEEALLLREHFTELLCTEISEKPQRFQDMTNRAEAASQAIEVSN